MSVASLVGPDKFQPASATSRGGVTRDIYCGIPMPAGPELDRRTPVGPRPQRANALPERERAMPPIFPGLESAYIGLRPFWSP